MKTSSYTLRIAVLVAPAVHPVSGRPYAGRADSAALALAKSLGGELSVFYAGTADDAALGDYLAQGADKIEVLAMGAGADIASLLAIRLSNFDVVLCGARSSGGDGSALLPYALAEALGHPLLPEVLAFSAERGGMRALQSLPKGQRRQLLTPFPFVATVHERAAAPLPYSFARKVEGKVLRSPPMGGARAPVHYEPGDRRARPLVAASRASGHERLLGAIAADDGKATAQVVKQGDSVEKAQLVLDYLRQHQLIDF
ncbi:electron transfer flavoprotein subunit beta [Crenobacter sp. SG2305]|uniref:electron transfer flavoprotein subunit beta n=1 Tax=Crenobacter oryzisoli TaxID=3056844 RepID=UPI0025AA9DD0|nr:electron transfer flavoprotein subunit beta [Crenobacter sp. SG2305]MDN0085323.1 electron transfer flavoprotein subunit beta [Crenobacter sp. SG2305]